MSELLEKEHDEFLNKTTITSKSIHDGNFEVSFRHICTPDTEKLMIDVIWKSSTKYGGQSFYPELERGLMVIRLNDSKNISLQPNKSECDNVRERDYEGYLFERHFESNYYEISQDILKEIGEASSMKIKIVGGKVDEVIEDEDKYWGSLRRIARVLYSNIYDADYFKKQISEDEINEKREIEELHERSRKREEEEERKKRQEEMKEKREAQADRLQGYSLFVFLFGGFVALLGGGLWALIEGDWGCLLRPVGIVLGVSILLFILSILSKH